MYLIPVANFVKCYTSKDDAAEKKVTVQNSPHVHAAITCYQKDYRQTSTVSRK